MTAIVLAMLIILAVVAGTAGVVVVGMQGRLQGRAPRLSERMARASEHLNGDGEPPKALLRFLS